jgi:polar amino acid transport system permease protein
MQPANTLSLGRPRGGIRRAAAESTRTSLAVLGLGAVALVISLAGSVVVLLVRGLEPVAALTAGLTSGAFREVQVAAILLGAVAGVTGGATFGRMPTKVSRNAVITGAVLGAEAAVVSLVLLGFSMGNVKAFVESFFDFSVVQSQLGTYLVGIKNTLILAFGGEFFGVLLGLLLAVFMLSDRKVVRAPARVYINVLRGTPLLWQLTFIYFGLNAVGVVLPVFSAAILTFSLNTASYSAEVFRAGLQSIERGQMEAARGLGMTYVQGLRHAVIPQAVRRVIPPLLNTFIALIKDTSLIFALGLTVSQYDLYTVGRQGYANTFNATYYIVSGLGYLTVTLPLIRFVNYVEHRLLGSHTAKEA